MTELSLQMVLGIREGMRGCVLDMGKTMGRVPERETIEKPELKKV